MIGEHRESPSSLIGTIWVTGAVALVTASITVVFLSMRAIMDIGGYCASGGPYYIETQCPDGVPGLLMGGIWIGLLAAFIYAWQAHKTGAVSLA